nr:MAG TPA: hypothetical protein [Caudoviricetes sp.]
MSECIRLPLKSQKNEKSEGGKDVEKNNTGANAPCD